MKNNLSFQLLQCKDITVFSFLHKFLIIFFYICIDFFYFYKIMITSFL
ncbi:hypothetical protein HMPREF9071_0177 [Capnocytophaga sp. oral taxon 338 str. F0234]|nr:hypothetical protein HMPREF9071_0177 [Capnocytophaga sp. oral taxon 338 str. F0234]